MIDFLIKRANLDTGPHRRTAHADEGGDQHSASTSQGAPENHWKIRREPETDSTSRPQEEPALLKP